MKWGISKLVLRGTQTKAISQSASYTLYADNHFDTYEEFRTCFIFNQSLLIPSHIENAKTTSYSVTAQFSVKFHLGPGSRRLVADLCVCQMTVPCNYYRGQIVTFRTVLTLHEH